MFQEFQQAAQRIEQNKKKTQLLSTLMVVIFSLAGMFLLITLFVWMLK